MHIKKISIQGFKTYKDQVEMDAFDPGLNAIVGRNGSGKSNFFAAIRFLLSDSHGNMGKEERQALLHEGSGPATVNAYVEAVFDNSDNRFPTGRSEVVLRRTIGLKKDEYQLDKKSVPKSEVVSLLESAGFSRYNPYFIVPQGRITALCNAKDWERLQLLKDVAGTRVYEQRREESKRIMEETEMKRQKIVELLEYIGERLQELEDEKSELERFQQLDRQRRGLEFTIYQREIRQVGEELQALEEEYSEERGKLEAGVQGHRQAAGQLKDLELELQRRLRERESKAEEKRRLTMEYQELQEALCKMELRLIDGKERSGQAQDRKTVVERELKVLEKELAEKQKQLESTNGRYETLRQEESQLSEELEQLQSRQHLLSQRQQQSGATKQHQKQIQREREKETALAQQELTSVEHLAKDELKQLKAIESEQIPTLQKDIEESEAKVEGAKNRQKQLSQEIQKLSSAQGQRMANKRRIWRQVQQLTDRRQQVDRELLQRQRSLQSAVDRQTSAGLDTVKKLTQRQQLQEKVFGPVYELFSADEVFNTCIDHVAGSSLFHVVVDSETTVIDKIIPQLSAGRVTFIPLDRIRKNKIKNKATALMLDDADSDRQEVIPLISKLNFDPKYRPAMEQIFGKWLLCPDIETASRACRQYKMNCVTIDGDKCENRGRAMTGGGADARESGRLLRMDHVQAIHQLKKELVQLDEQLQKISDGELKSIDAEYATQQQQLVQAQSESSGMQSTRELTGQRLVGLRRRLQTLERSVEDHQRLAEDYRKKVSIVKNKLEALKQPLKPLNAKEEVELQVLVSKELPAMRKRLSDLSARRLECELERTDIQSAIDERLVRRQDDLQKELDGLTSSFATNEVETIPLEQLTVLRASSAELEKSRQLVDDALSDLDQAITECQSGVDELQSEQAAHAKSVDRLRQIGEQFAARKSLLVKSQQEFSTKIKHLGAVSDQSAENGGITGNENLKTLIRKLHKVSEELKKFQHVNKKAYEQFQNFTKQREQLLGRQKELDDSQRAIVDLMETLDQRKNEAIDRTFTEVARHFAEAFGLLVPRGQGSLHMLRAMDRGDDEGDDVDDNSSASASVQAGRSSSSSMMTDSHYTGVSIRVSFNSKTADEGLLMSQLSGGQKSLVALALIFAIQQSDPAPFYLFDEIDANLDSASRTAVAAAISQYSQTAQFIVTTFRPEMLRYASQFYGVSFNKDKVSNIRCISRSDAMDFVEHEPQQQEEDATIVQH